MAAVWSGGTEVSVQEVSDRLSDEPAPAYTTVKTTMDRLTTKGLLSRRREARAYRYQAVHSQLETERRIVIQALEQLARDFPRAMGHSAP